MERMKAWGFNVGCIHGGMKPGSRDEPGTRLHAEQEFREGNIQILVATEAAGEGINLQCCHILFNYDIPWNPNRLEQRMGRIHRYGQRRDCLIFNFVAGNTIEGRVLQRLHDKLDEIRDALDDDAVFNVVGEVLPAAHVDRVLRDYYAGKLGDADLEDRMLKDVDEERFRAICQTALEGLASKRLNLDMLIERRARAQERRVVPETIARFMRACAESAGLSLRPINKLDHAFRPGRTPTALKIMDRDPTWKLPSLAAQYPGCQRTGRRRRRTTSNGSRRATRCSRRCADTAWPAGRKCSRGAPASTRSRTETPARIDFYRARVVDGLGQTIHERLLTIEVTEGREPRLREPEILGNLIPTSRTDELPSVATLPEESTWLNEHALQPFLDDVRSERLAEVERIAEHVELSLTEVLQRTDDEIGRAAEEVDKKVAGAEGRLAQAEARHTEVRTRREGRRNELAQQRALTLQSVERMTSVLVLPHPDRETADVQRLRPNPETEQIAMDVVMQRESALGRKVTDVHKENLGYDVTSLDLRSGELRLIEVKGLSGPTAASCSRPTSARWPRNRRDCYWLYVVTNCAVEPELQDPIRDPARFPWHEVRQGAALLDGREDDDGIDGKRQSGRKRRGRGQVIPRECKRLAEVDFPIAAVSRHAVREKSIRHGHPSTLHLWWARRPLASSRAVLMALLLPDPCDPQCPEVFRREARRILLGMHGRPKGWAAEVESE